MGNPKRLIIADDTKDQLEAYMFLFRSYTPDTIIDAVSDGESLVKRVRENSYNLILTDNNMPGMSGLDAIQEIRNFDDKTPIYMMSCIHDEKLERLVKQFGGNGFIRKADEKSLYELKEIITKYLK